MDVKEELSPDSLSEVDVNVTKAANETSVTLSSGLNSDNLWDDLKKSDEGDPLITFFNESHSILEKTYFMRKKKSNIPASKVSINNATTGDARQVVAALKQLKKNNALYFDDGWLISLTSYYPETASYLDVFENNIHTNMATFGATLVDMIKKSSSEKLKQEDIASSLGCTKTYLSKLQSKGFEGYSPKAEKILIALEKLQHDDGFFDLCSTLFSGSDEVISLVKFKAAETLEERVKKYIDKKIQVEGNTLENLCAQMSVDVQFFRKTFKENSLTLRKFVLVCNHFNIHPIAFMNPPIREIDIEGGNPIRSIDYLSPIQKKEKK